MTELLKGIRNLGFPKLPDPLFSCYEFSDEQEQVQEQEQPQTAESESAAGKPS